MGTYVTGTGQELSGVHPESACADRGACCIHNPSDHSMRDWPTHWGLDGMMYRVGPLTGTLYPDPDDLAFHGGADEAFTRNMAKCAQCGDVIESRYRHDFVTCGCGAISVDGGNDYYRRSGSPSDFIDLSKIRDRVLEEQAIILGLERPAADRVPYVASDDDDRYDIHVAGTLQTPPMTLRPTKVVYSLDEIVEPEVGQLAVLGGKVHVYCGDDPGEGWQLLEKHDAHRPRRGDDVDRWLKRWRDSMTSANDHHLIDTLLDDYRLHADTGTDLGEEVQDGPADG